MKKTFDVIILCGGYGKRLRPYTLNNPKPLLKVNNKPFIYFLIKQLLRINIGNIIIAAGYKFKKFIFFKNKYFKFHPNVKIINSGNVDIINRLQDSCKFLKNDFFVCYGDTYVNLNFRNYISFFLRSKNISSVIGTYYQIKYGLFKFNKFNKIITKFMEKPIIKDPINLGYFIFKRELIKDINKSKTWNIFLKKLIKRKKIKSFLIPKVKHFTFDTPQEYFHIKSKIIK
jgi:NDP-sugar pyrophosphorylase family protein